MELKSTGDPLNLNNLPYDEKESAFIAKVLEFVDCYHFARPSQTWNVYVFVKSVFGHAGLMFEAHVNSSITSIKK